MRSISLPYAENCLLYLLFMGFVAGICGGLLVALNKPLGFVIGGLWLTLSAASLWRFFSLPRLVEVDLSTGVTHFIPPRWSKKSNKPPVDIRQYRSVHAALRRPGLSYYVALSNHRGESTTLLWCVAPDEARRACDVISTEFKLRNLGLN